MNFDGSGIEKSAIRNPQSAIGKLRVQMIVSGVGGQGVLLLTRAFSEVALKEGRRNSKVRLAPNIVEVLAAGEEQL